MQTHFLGRSREARNAPKRPRPSLMVELLWQDTSAFALSTLVPWKDSVLKAAQLPRVEGSVKTRSLCRREVLCWSEGPDEAPADLCQRRDQKCK
ncbi:hypothetical protein KRP22_015020 [Phytophthora ramorum]|nr:hypothetical protein KRP22_4802 [Phytophthora ramorum]